MQDEENRKKRQTVMSGVFHKMVEARGLEPMTPSTSRKCSPN